MAIYRPSETKAWLTCPVKRSLEYLDGWLPRTLSKKHLSAILGTGIHAGAAVYHQALKEGAPPDVSQAQAVAVSAVRAEREKYESLGCVIRPEEMPLADSLELRATTGVARYISADPIKDKVLHVEQRLENFGGCTIDLGVDGPLGLAISDVKTRQTLDDRYRQKTKLEYSVDWQMRHYCWAYGQYMGQPCTRYNIILVTLEPFSVEVWPYELKDEDLLAWHLSAENAWWLMDSEERVGNGSWQNLLSCHTSFGPCDYLSACHKYHYEESLMKHEYVRRGR